MKILKGKRGRDRQIRFQGRAMIRRHEHFERDYREGDWISRRGVNESPVKDSI